MARRKKLSVGEELERLGAEGKELERRRLALEAEADDVFRRQKALRTEMEDHARRVNEVSERWKAEREAMRIGPPVEKRGDLTSRIIELLEGEPDHCMENSYIWQRLGGIANKATVNSTLHRLHLAGRIERVSTGEYRAKRGGD